LIGLIFVDSVSGYPLLINSCDELGADSKNRPEFLARAKKQILITGPNEIRKDLSAAPKQTCRTAAIMKAADK